MEISSPGVCWRARGESVEAYPCGPTWPVPDVYKTLVNALVRNGTGFNAVSAAECLEGLEEEKYVLEVY